MTSYRYSFDGTGRATLQGTQGSNISDWENDPEFQQAVRDAKAAGAMVPNVLDWAQYKAECARDK